MGFIDDLRKRKALAEKKALEAKEANRVKQEANRAAAKAIWQARAAQEAAKQAAKHKPVHKPLASDGCMVTKPYREHFPDPFTGARQVSALMMDQTIRVDDAFVEWAKAQPVLREIQLRIVMSRGALVHRTVLVSQLDEVLKARKAA